VDSSDSQVSHLPRWAATSFGDGGSDRVVDSLRVSTSRLSEHIRVVVVTGEIDMLSAPELDAAVLYELEQRPALVVLDLRRVEYLGSAGLASLMGVREAAWRVGAALRLVCSGPHVLRPMDLTGITGLFEFYSDIDDATTQN